MTTNLINQEIEELRIAIAEEMGWKIENYGPKGYETLYWRLRRPDGTIREQGCTGKDWSHKMFGLMVPPYTTSIDAIREAAMERFKSGEDAFAFHGEIIRLECDGDKYCWQLTALDWAIAFARTAKIWRYKV